VVAVADAARVGAAIEWWDRRRTDAGTAAFIAEGPDGLVLCISATDAWIVDDFAAQLGTPVGLSGEWEYAHFSQAHAQAVTALRRGTESGVTHYADAAAGGVLEALATDEARLIAQTRLAPVRAHDAASGTELERTLTVWLEHDAGIESAASALGIHRHTLRSRIAQAGALLSTDLSSFPARAELWAALRTAE
jgi:purine catabolism regulator